MRFLADMCVDVRIVEWLRKKGHDATHLRDQGLHRMPNGDIFEKAILEDRIVITFESESVNTWLSVRTRPTFQYLYSSAS